MAQGAGVHAARCRRDHQASTAQNSRTDSACRTSRPARAAHIRPLACPESYRPIASRLRRQHARAAACCPTYGPCSRRVSRLSVYGWQPPGSRTMPSCLCCEQKRPRPSPAWLKLGRLLQPSAAQRFCFTLTMPGRRCGEQYRPCARARPAARGGPARAGSGAGRVPRARCIRRRCGRRDADAHEPCHCVRWHGMSGGSEWLRPCTQQQHHAAGPAPDAAPPQRCWKAMERREAGRGAAPACSRAC